MCSIWIADKSLPLLVIGHSSFLVLTDYSLSAVFQLSIHLTNKLKCQISVTKI